jgi:hypothetical protein
MISVGGIANGSWPSLFVLCEIHVAARSLADKIIPVLVAETAVIPACVRMLRTPALAMHVALVLRLLSIDSTRARAPARARGVF